MDNKEYMGRQLESDRQREAGRQPESDRQRETSHQPESARQQLTNHRRENSRQPGSARPQHSSRQPRGNVSRGKSNRSGSGNRRKRGSSSGGSKSIASELMMLLMKIGMIVIFFVIMFTFFFGIMQQSDQSMEPAIKEGDLIIYYRLQKDYESRDAVIVENPEGKKQCRRVVAVAGDQLEITEDGLKINGYRQQEDDIFTETLPYVGDVEYPVSLTDGNYFVLADNRENSEDSRVYGQVQGSATKGKVMTIIRRRGI